MKKYLIHILSVLLLFSLFFSITAPVFAQDSSLGADEQIPAEASDAHLSSSQEEDAFYETGSAEITSKPPQYILISSVILGLFLLSFVLVLLSVLKDRKN